MNVLVVDDEPIVRLGLKTLVDWEGNGFHHAGEAEDGEEAWTQIESLQIDIVITDLIMPVMDGLELIRKLETHFRPVSVVALSCMDDFTYVKEAMKHGAKDYILKPTMEPEQLVQILHVVKDDLVHTRHMKRQLSYIQQSIPEGFDLVGENGEARLQGGEVGTNSQGEADADSQSFMTFSNPFLQKALHYMYSNYTRNFSTKELAEHVRLSRSYLSDLYSKEAGEPLSETLTRIRVDKSKEIVCRGGLKMYEIAEAVGFTDARVFVKSFKRLVGCTPREYEARAVRSDG